MGTSMGIRAAGLPAFEPLLMGLRRHLVAECPGSVAEWDMVWAVSVDPLAAALSYPGPADLDLLRADPVSPTTYEIVINLSKWARQHF
jgi:hypothetical protein